MDEAKQTKARATKVRHFSSFPKGWICATRQYCCLQRLYHIDNQDHKWQCEARYIYEEFLLSYHKAIQGVKQFPCQIQPPTVLWLRRVL